MLKLVIAEKDGQAVARNFAGQERITIGRSQDSDIVLDRSNVTARHAEISFSPPVTWTVVDLKSTNGTYLNGRRADPKVALKRGDVVQVGDFVLKIVDLATPDGTPIIATPPRPGKQPERGSGAAAAQEGDGPSREQLAGVLSALADWRAKATTEEERAPYPQGWSVAHFDPGGLLACFPNLRFSDSHELWALHHQMGTAGLAVLLAAPRGRAPLDLTGKLDRFPAPFVEEEDLKDPLQLMEAPGELTAQGAVEMALLCLELQNLCASGQDRRWLQEEVLLDEEAPLRAEFQYERWSICLTSRHGAERIRNDCSWVPEHRFFWCNRTLERAGTRPEPRWQSRQAFSQEEVQPLRDGVAKQVRKRTLSLRPYREGWNRARYDPNKLLALFPRLGLAPGHKLATYQYIAGGNGAGYTVVIPSDRKLPRIAANLPRMPFPPEEIASEVDLDIAKYLVPAGPVEPMTFLEASLFMREIRELGARWHDVRWYDNELLFGPTGNPQVDNHLGGEQPLWDPEVLRGEAYWEVRLRTKWGSIYSEDCDYWSDDLNIPSPWQSLILVEGAPIIH